MATLVAREHSPDDVFASLTEELGLLFEVDASAILRYEADATATVVAYVIGIPSARKLALPPVRS